MYVCHRFGDRVHGTAEKAVLEVLSFAVRNMESSVLIFSRRAGVMHASEGRADRSGMRHKVDPSVSPQGTHRANL